MAQFFQPVPHRFGRSWSDHQGIAFIGLTCIGHYLPSVAVQRLEGLDPRRSQHFNAVGRRHFFQTVDDGLRRIGHRKNAVIGFNLELYTPIRKPFHGIAGLEFVEGPQELTAAARIELDQFPWIKTRVRHVAAPATTDQNLAQYIFTFFQ